MKEETKKQSTELATTEAKPAVAPTPFGFMRRFATDMERLFEDFESFRFPSLFGREFFPFTREFEHVDWSPAIEVRQDNGQFIIRTDLPGLKKDDVKVELTDNLLTISGERKEQKEEKREGYYRSERSYGSFYRQVPLPEGAKTDTATAEFTDGVLQITMQAPEREPKPRRLEIKKGEEPAKAIAAAK
ncbi:MAG TPA: Hsp20/alpha crystallin family protein [Pyrinomonadaceae bacterium]|nr:Hsp20/alpha crystallin family protein [Pyrinomonadaceae bacterium]